MPRRLTLALIAALVLGAALAALLLDAPPVAERDLSALSGDVNRGAYVARLSGCIACHTDVRGGGAVLAGGVAIESEFGTFYGPNITPHPETGIGNWSLADFARALRAGVNPQGQHYYPAFPYPFYSRLSDQDIVDLWAAVRSVPAVDRPSKDHELAFPFTLRSGLRYWKALFLTPGALAPASDKSDAWNRGRYLAEAAGHCGACHTPRNPLGAREASLRYAGSVAPDGGKIPPITPESLSRGHWTQKNLAFALRTGIMPDGDAFGGSMVDVVRDGTQYWSDQDLMALAAYLFDP